jgi:hypothetical protein
MAAKVFPGKSLPGPLRKAGFVNDIIDCVENYKSSALGGGTRSIGLKLPTDLVKIRNTTGDDLDPGSCLQLGDLLLDDDPNSRYPWFEADYAADPVYRNYCVLREPIPDGKIGLAQISGTCVARVHVLNSNHTHAIPVSAAAADSLGIDQGVLVSDFIGPIEILSPLDVPADEDSDDPQLVFVNLKCDIPELLVKGSAIDKGASGTLRIYTGPLDSPVDSGNDLEDVFCIYTDYAGDLWAQVDLLNGHKSIHAIECP